MHGISFGTTGTISGPFELGFLSKDLGLLHGLIKAGLELKQGAVDRSDLHSRPRGRDPW